jgi:hypothetical protein
MTWKPDREEALKTLIRQTIKSAGDTTPAELPHVIKARLKDQAGEGADLDRLIKEILKEQRGDAHRA